MTYIVIILVTSKIKFWYLVKNRFMTTKYVNINYADNDKYNVNIISNTNLI